MARVISSVSTILTVLAFVLVPVTSWVWDGYCSSRCHNRKLCVEGSGEKTFTADHALFFLMESGFPRSHGLPRLPLSSHWLELQGRPGKQMSANANGKVT